MEVDEHWPIENDLRGRRLNLPHKMKVPIELDQVNMDEISSKCVEVKRTSL